MGNGLKWPYCHLMPDTEGMTQDQINNLAADKMMRFAGWMLTISLISLMAAW